MWGEPTIRDHTDKLSVHLTYPWLPQYVKPVTVSLCPECYRLCAHDPPVEPDDFVLPGRYGERLFVVVDTC